jgi:hypothetical protein
MEVNMSNLSPLELLHGAHSETDTAAPATNTDPMALLDEATRQSLEAAGKARHVYIPHVIDTTVPPAEEPYLNVDYVGPPVGADNAPL